MLTVVCAVPLAACATAGASRQVVERVWPDPPLTARIKLIGVLGEENRGEPRRQTGFTEAVFGARAAVSLSQPMGIAWSRARHRAYVTDYAEHAVFTFDPTRGRLERFGDGTHAFVNPLGIAVDDRDRVYVVDSTPRRISVFDADGRLVRTIAHPSLERPTGVAVDSRHGRLYVADSARLSSENHRILVFDLEGTYVNAFGVRGWEHGQFLFPTFLAVDQEGQVHVADTLNGRVEVFTPEGRYVRTIGRPGDAPGTFDKPKGIAFDSFGNVYVTDSAASNVQIFNARGDVLLVFGVGGRAAGYVVNPTGIAIDPDNRIFVADAFTGRINVYQLVNTRAEDSVLTATAPAGRE